MVSLAMVIKPTDTLVMDTVARLVTTNMDRNTLARETATDMVTAPRIITTATGQITTVRDTDMAMGTVRRMATTAKGRDTVVIMPAGRETDTDLARKPFMVLETDRLKALALVTDVDRDSINMPATTIGSWRRTQLFYPPPLGQSLLRLAGRCAVV